MASPPVHPACLDAQHLLAQCDLRRGRTSGPGGQRRNKVETAVTLRHRPTGLESHASERRSLVENQHKALFRLRLQLAIAQHGWFDLREAPSVLWRSRCSREGLMRVNPEHHDYPAILAEALDVLRSLKYDPARAAMLLGCTTSQLVKLIKDCPPAIAWLNQQRRERHLPPLR